MENLTTRDGNKPSVEDVLTKVNGLWWMVDMFVVFARTDISYEPPLKQYFIYDKILKDIDYALTNRQVLNRSFETFRSLYGNDARLEFTDDEILNRALKRLLVDPDSMNNPFEFQVALNGIRAVIKQINNHLNRQLIEYELVESKKSLEKEYKRNIKGEI